MADFIDVVATNIQLIGAIITLILFPGAILAFWKSNWPRIKRIRYYISNKLIRVNLDAAKDYPVFQPNIQRIRGKIIDTFEKKSRKIRFEAVGKNYLILLVEDMLGPFKVEFHPKIADEEDPIVDETKAHEVVIGTEVRIRYVGTLKFYYRKDAINMDYLNSIDALFEAIESEYNVRAEYRNYHLVSTPSTDFNEDWSRCLVKEEREARVAIGTKVVDVNSTSITPLYDAYKRNIVGV